jgi:hypothetical protein
LAERYFSFSPYCYVGNNPITRTDPDGRYWLRDKDRETGWQQMYFHSNRINGLSAQETQLNSQINAINNNGNLTEEQKSSQIAGLNSQISDIKSQITENLNAMSELNAMQQSKDVAFTFNDVGTAGSLTNITHGTTKGADGKDDMLITINNFGTSESKAHESKHAYQALTGKIIPGKGKNMFFYPGFRTPQLAEVEAYQREYAAGTRPMPYSHAGSVNIIGDVNREWVMRLYIYRPGVSDETHVSLDYMPYSADKYRYAK